jgi:hypothetical protein
MVKDLYSRIIWAFLILSCIRNWWVKIGFVVVRKKLSEASATFMDALLFIAY